MAVRFRLRQRGVDEITQSAKVKAYLESAGSIVKNMVESQAASFAHTRYFARHIVKGPIRQGTKGPKLTVYSTDFAAHIVEFGSINNPAYAPFRRACAALGLKLTGGGDRP